MIIKTQLLVRRRLRIAALDHSEGMIAPKLRNREVEILRSEEIS